jgi:hypothetical protein
MAGKIPEGFTYMSEPENVRRRRLNHDRLNRDTYDTYVGARISHEQRERLQRIAAHQDDSISEIVSRAVEKLLRSKPVREILSEHERTDH